jgi:hypothetical protein
MNVDEQSHAPGKGIVCSRSEADVKVGSFRASLNVRFQAETGRFNLVNFVKISDDSGNVRFSQ